jgi:AraC-like DNA-binding protein
MAVRIGEAHPGASFHAAVRRQWIDDLALVDCECDPCSGARGRSRISATNGDYIAVLITRKGRETVVQADSQNEMRAGDAVVWDTRTPIRFTVWEPLIKRSLLIPRTALADVSGRSWSVAGIVLPGDAPATKLLVGYLDLLASSLGELSAAGVSAARNATLELFVGAARPGPGVADASAVTPALRATMESWINRHLTDGEITPAAIAAAHGVSVRTVYRIFEASSESVSAYVRMRRLARARLDIAAEATPIAVIAHRWGFSDSSHFARAFKIAYGVSASDYRSDARSQLQANPASRSRSAHAGALPA